MRYRTLAEIAPSGTAGPAELAEARRGVAESKAAQAIIAKQAEHGTWGGSLAGLVFGKTVPREPGTVAQYRRLLQLGYPGDARPMKLAERTLYRVLSRDPDPALLFEAEKSLRKDAVAQGWAREAMREAAAGALAEAGHVDDPRLRGAGHRIATAVSQFLRSPLAEDPFTKAGRTTILHPEAHPPSWYSVAMLGAMPNLRRERAGFTERLGHYLAQPAPKKSFVLQVGDASAVSDHLLLGDPIHADAKAGRDAGAGAAHERVRRAGRLAAGRDQGGAEDGRPDDLALLAAADRGPHGGGAPGGRHVPARAHRPAARNGGGVHVTAAQRLDLTPFGFTPTESLVYEVLLTGGPGTGYAIARTAGLARANAYGALEGLVAKGAARMEGGRPRRYRPEPPTVLLARIASDQGQALERLRSRLDTIAVPETPTLVEIESPRGALQLIGHETARAQESVRLAAPAEAYPLLAPSLRRPVTAGLAVTLLAAGGVARLDFADVASIEPRDWPGVPLLAIIDGRSAVVATRDGTAVRGHWSTAPAFVAAARLAFERLEEGG